jgi:kumamolisin
MQYKEISMSARAHMVPIHGSQRPATPQAKLVGKSDDSQRIKVSIYVRTNPHPPADSLRAVEGMNAELPGQRKYLGDDDFNAIYGADPADLDKVVAWVTKHKLTVVDRSVPMRRLQVEGTIGDVSAALGVELKEYEHPKLGHYRGREGEIYVPEDLSDIVTGVFGLDTRPLGHSRLRRGPMAPVEWETVMSRPTGPAKSRAAATAAVATNPFPGTFFPPQVAQLYNYPGTLNGSGENIAIFAFNGGSSGDPRGGYKLSALQTYFEKVLGGTTPSITDVVVQGPGNDPGPDTPTSGNQGDSTGEVMLDMCVVGSVAPGAKIFMYFTEFTNQGWVDALHQAIAGNNQISVISISYGNPEKDPNSAWTQMGVRVVNQAMQAAMAKGITICVASGDDGSSDGATRGSEVDFPASSPFVLGVGGTKLVASNSSTPHITSEIVWNELLHDEGAGGGGVSAVFTKPSYQNGVNVPPSANPPHRIGRGVPDVCALADPVTGVVIMNVDGKHLEAIGGTSAAAPLWASLIGRLNQGLNARCGFLNQVLYTKFPTGVLRDITVGNNGSYSAGPGWDACTGLGSPDGQKLLKALSG